MSKIWDKLKKVKWKIEPWNRMLMGGSAILFANISYVINYSETVERGKNLETVLKSYIFVKLSYQLDSAFGKTATIVILGLLTLIPFIIAWRMYKKQKRKQNE